MVVGGLFVLLGVFLVIPTFGAFGLLWTAVATAIALYYAYNLFNDRGVSTYEVNVEAPGSVDALDDSLRKLARLKNDGLINEQEFEQKRAEILRRR
jgi:cytochrome c-type biogenesis protein CcmH/NrfG